MSGASMSIALVANIAVSIIMILGMLELFNTILTWLGMMVGIKQLTFQVRSNADSYAKYCYVFKQGCCACCTSLV